MIIMSAMATGKKQMSMLQAINLQAERLNKNQIKAKKATVNLTKSTKDLTNESEKLDKSFARRTANLGAAITSMNEMGKQFELLNYGSFKAFKTAGGNAFEYIDLLLSGTSEKIKLMGGDVSTVRKVMYGFLPPGMFRMVNKLSTGMKFLGTVTRAFGGAVDEEGKKVNNAFTKMGTGIKFLLGKRKKAVNVELGLAKKARAIKGKFIDLDLKANLKAEDKRLKSKLKSHDYFINLAKDGQKNQKRIVLEATKEIAAERLKIENKARKQTEKIMGGYSATPEFAKMQEDIEKGLLNLSAKDPNSAINKAQKRKGSSEASEKKAAKFLATEIERKTKYNKKSKKDSKRTKKLIKKQAYLLKIAKRRERSEKLNDKAKNMWKNKLKPMLAGAGTFFLYFLLFAATVIAAMVVLQALWPQIKAAAGPAFEVMKAGFMLVWEGLSVFFGGIFDLFDAIMNGGFIDIMLALWEIVKGFGMILWGLVKIIFGGLLTFIGVLLVGLWDKAYKWVTSLGNDIKSVGKIAGLVLAVIVMIIAAIWGAPIMLIIGLGILAYKVGKWLVSQIPGFASGGVSAGGMSIVGEKGPELVNLPKGSRVHSNSQSKTMVGGGTTNNFNITINARDTSDGELRRIADKIGQMVSSKINRSTSSSTMR